MGVIPPTDPIPLREDADGSIRIGNTRVLLELVVNAWEDGATPEAVVQKYPTLQLSEVYGVIAYYLRHRAEVADYLRRREAKAQEVRQRVESNQRDLGEVRRRILARRGPKG
jgi:uncharacterized protein (DUF433 family)